MKPLTLVAGLLVALAGATAYGQQVATGDRYVSKEEHEKLKRELDAMKAQMRQMQELLTNGVPVLPATLQVGQDQEKEALKKDVTSLKGQIQELQTKTETHQTEMDETIEDLEKSLKAVKDQAQAASPGTTNFLITGYGFAGFEDRHGENSTFNAGFNPIFLWRLSDRIFFEGELEVELESEDGEGETHIELEYGQLTYILNDCMIIGAGRFLTPFGIFSERLHPAWINKLPDAPLAFGHDGLVPGSSLGVQVRGVIPMCHQKLVYAFYLSNGPRLNTGEDEPEEAGALHFDNFEDINNNKAFGGRVGWLFNPALEVGYSFKVAEVGPSGPEFNDIHAVIQGVDLSYVKVLDCICGTIDLRTEWVWSEVDDATYELDLGGPLPVPVTFDNKRNGGYVQLAYRPTKYEGCIKDFEPIFRFDTLNRPGDAPDPIEHFDEQRWTLGLNYWLGPSTVVKVAYQWDNRNEGEDDANAFLAQFAIGF